MIKPNITENTAVIMQSPDGYKMRAVYVGYVTECQRYEFLIKIGNGEGTRVLFPKEMINKYNFTIDPDEAR